jgi:hypothetical protein
MHSTRTPAHTGAPAARVFAFYLPQFHPIPENDRWWGPGFTEWTNVAKAKPLFPGHIQPRLPADLGFYDLRVPEVRERQAELAAEAGIESFCYWHYWFGNGRRILERPFEEVLASGKPDFPFCLAWANQSWTGIWHGATDRILVEQLYPGPADREAHFNWARRAFEDPRYTKVDGKPVFMIFAPAHLPSSTEFVEHWRELAVKAGYPGLYMVGVAEGGWSPGLDRYAGDYLKPFDAVTILGPTDYLFRRGRLTKARRIWKERNFGPLKRFMPSAWQRPTRIDFRDVVEHAFDDMPEGERFLPTVLAGWDNTPRSGPRGVVYENFTADLFQTNFEKAIARMANHSPSKKIIFLKAWNEWAEGNIVEPCALYGHQLLDATRAAVWPTASAASVVDANLALAAEQLPAEATP